MTPASRGNRALAVRWPMPFGALAAGCGLAILVYQAGAVPLPARHSTPPALGQASHSAAGAETPPRSVVRPMDVTHQLLAAVQLAPAAATGLHASSGVTHVVALRHLVLLGAGRHTAPAGLLVASTPPPPVSPAPPVLGPPVPTSPGTAVPPPTDPGTTGTGTTADPGTTGTGTTTDPGTTGTGTGTTPDPGTTVTGTTTDPAGTGTGTTTDPASTGTGTTTDPAGTGSGTTTDPGTTTNLTTNLTTTVATATDSTSSPAG